GSLHCPSAWVPCRPVWVVWADYFGAGLAPRAPPDDSKVVGAVVRTTATVQRGRRDLSWNDSTGPALSFAGRHRRAGRSGPSLAHLLRRAEPATPGRPATPSTPVSPSDATLRR